MFSSAGGVINNFFISILSIAILTWFIFGTVIFVFEIDIISILVHIYWPGRWKCGHFWISVIDISDGNGQDDFVKILAGVQEANGGTIEVLDINENFTKYNSLDDAKKKWNIICFRR